MMITRSFILLDRIGIKKEKSIWCQGIRDWQTFISCKKINGISDNTKYRYDRILKTARKKLFEGDSKYFTSIFPSSENWRFYNFFREDALFLDIEMSCGRRPFMTAITLYDGTDLMTMVRGVNLDMRKVRSIIEKHPLVVTFNGSSYDIPYLERICPGLKIDMLHFDLRYGCARVGLLGGLKSIETNFGIVRDASQKLYGDDPIHVWRKFIGTSQNKYLDMLVDYNQDDAGNLQKIADHVYGELKKNTLVNNINKNFPN